MKSDHLIEERMAASRYRLSTDDDAIIRVQLSPDSRLTITEAESIVDEIKELRKGQKAVVLTDITRHEGFTSDRETRDFLAHPDIGEIVNACAILIGSPMGGFLGNFFLRINKPPYKVRLFTSEKKAVEWLKKNIS
ncbi:MAG: hypothetical protein OEV06_01615 [Anaerolineae bacterium]|nr:hypothetical protein [Anaerolineae bacterium]